MPKKLSLNTESIRALNEGECPAQGAAIGLPSIPLNRCPGVTEGAKCRTAAWTNCMDCMFK